MLKRLLVTYKLHSSVNTLFVFFCLFILSGCGSGMITDGSGGVSTLDNGNVIGGDGEEVIGEYDEEVIGEYGEEVIGEYDEEVIGEYGEEVIGENAGEVTPVGFIKLSWRAPMSKVDGSALTNLGGYRIYYRKTDDIDQVFTMDIGTVTSVTVDNLSPGRWCFAITAYNDSNNESDFSNSACKDI